MPSVSLKIHIVKSNNTKTLKFDAKKTVYDATELIREKVPDARQGQATEYGLFLPGDDPTKGRWLEQGRILEYYHLTDGDTLEYKTKQRVLRFKTVDGSSILTVLIDDSATVEEITNTVCAKIDLRNPEEFSLLFDSEAQDSIRKGPTTLTRQQKELEKLKRKLHTDDELNWLRKDMTLREQGITDETQVLTLRKRLFFHDQNVDVNDPVQLNLLYVQCRDCIINGSYPCTKDEAVQFAAYQCQVQYGRHNPSRHKPGFLSLPELLPQEYVKVKAIDKAIFHEHNKLGAMTDLQAKFRYIQDCRNLRTYGVTFFLVKEKVRGKSKLVPRLLGIARDSIMRVDETTKEIIKSWPLFTVRRWAASHNSFTIDFGDYSEAFYSVQTMEGDKISRLISSYIKLILETMPQAPQMVPRDDQEPVMEETENLPQMANTMIVHPSTMGQGSVEDLAHSGVLQNPQLVDSVERGLGTIRTLMASLQAPIPASRAGIPPDVCRQNIHATMAAILASAASVITQTTTGDPEDIDYIAVGTSVSVISSNLVEMSQAVRMLASLFPSESEGNNLLDAAAALAAACADLMGAARPENLQNRQEVLASAGEMGTKGGQLLLLVGDLDMDARAQASLVQMAKTVAATTSSLVSNAREVSKACQDPAIRQQVDQAAERTVWATQALIACTKVLAPCIDTPLCQDQLTEACKVVSAAVRKLVLATQAACMDDDSLRDLGAAAAAVTDALRAMLEQLKLKSSSNSETTEEVFAAIVAAADNLLKSMGDHAEMLRNTKILAETTSSLVSLLKMEAEEEMDPAARQMLLDAARSLADATSRMVEAAKMAARNPGDEMAEDQLRLATDHVKAVALSASSALLRRKAIGRLETAAKDACAVSTQFIAASRWAGNSNTDEASQRQLIELCKAVGEHISSLVQAVRNSVTGHSNPAAQLDLINESLAMIPPAGKMVSGATAVVPNVEDQLAALQLGNSAKATASALGLLRDAALRAQEVCGPLEIDCAINAIGEVKEDLEVAKGAAHAHNLPQPLHQSLPNSVTELNAASKAVGSSMAQLVTAAHQSNVNFTGVAAKDTAKTLGVLAGAVKGVASFSKDPETQIHIIATAQQLMDESVLLVTEAKQAIEDPSATDKQVRLARAAKAASQALNLVVNCLPGLIEIDQSLKDLEQANAILHSGKFPDAGGRSYQVLQANLTEAASGLNLASSQVVASMKREPDEQASSTNNFVGCYKELLTVGLTLAGIAREQQNQQAMVEQMSRVSEKANGLLFASRMVAKDPDTMDGLLEAARNLADSLNTLLGLSAMQGPGLKECDDALRKIESVAASLDNPNQAVSNLSYFDCIDVVMEKSLILGDAGNQIKTTSRNGDFDQFGVVVDTTALAVCQLTEATVQAAYLVGVADSGSEAGVQGLVDPAQFAEAQRTISLACQSLLSASATQEQVLSSATAIAQNTSVLCSSCKLAASKTTDEDIRGKFMDAAKDVASATSNLVKNIRVLGGDINEENRGLCAKSSGQLLEAVDELVTYASSSLFASSPAKFSSQAREAQEPILQAGKNVIKSSSSLLASAKSLAVDPSDMNLGQLLAQHSKAVSDSVKALLLAIRTKCPGQKDCDHAIDAISDSVNQLDQAILAALSQSLHPPTTSTSLQGYQEQMMECVGQIGDLLHPLSNAAKGEVEVLGQQVSAMADLFQTLARVAIGEASLTTSSHMQTSLLEHSKSLAESGLQLMYAVKEAGGNPKRVQAHSKVEQGVKLVTAAVSDLVSLLEKVESEAGFVAGMVEMITQAQGHLSVELEEEIEESFADYQSSTIVQSKALVKSTQEMVAASKSHPKEIFTKAKNVTTTYCQLVEMSRYCLATIESDQVADELVESVRGTGDVCISLIKAGSAVSGSPEDQSLKRALMDQARIVAEKVGRILSAVQSAAVGTQACNEAVATIKGIMGDIETTAMFARAGALNPESEVGSFAEHRESILETAKKLAEFPKILLNNIAEGQEQLKTAAMLGVRIMANEAENVKLGAASLTSDDTAAQMLLLKAVKEVAGSLAELMNAARITSGKNSGDQAWESLKNCAKGMVATVSALLKTVKSVEDEAGRGVRLLEITIDKIDAELKDYDSDSAPKVQASVEDMVQATKEIALASSKTVSAGNSCRQVEVSAAANISAAAVQQLLHTCKSVAVNSPGTESHAKVMSVGRDCAVAFKTLLELVHQIVLKPSPDLKKKLPAFSKEVASTVAEIIGVASQLKEGAGFFDPSDPRARAEQELLAAAASIEAAAKKLSGLKPRRKVDADESLTFDEQILEAAKSIAAATKDLVQYARVAQAELVRQGRVSGRNQSSEDSQWSEGLVSAAKLVATATSNLCEAANQVVQGEADEHKLITAAKAVSSHTTQLLIACNVKADANSESNRRLQIAGDAVKKATDALVKAAESAIANSKDEVVFGKDVSILTGAQKHMMDELHLQEKIARARREIDKLEEQLSQVQKGVTKDMTAMAGGVGRRRFMVELEIKDLLAKKYKNLNGLEADLARLRKEAYQ